MKQLTLGLIESYGIVKLSIDDEPDVILSLKRSAVNVLEQYEGVVADLQDPTVLETVAM